MTNTTQDNEMKQQSQSNELTGSLVASDSATTITHHPDHTKEFYEQELKRYNVAAQDYMYNWIRSKSGK